MNIASNTIVKNGMPFIGEVLRNVQPFVDKMFITVSEKSTDGTKDIVEAFRQEFRHKVEVDTENVVSPAELTTVRQKQLDKVPDNWWVLFLDDDDWWSSDELHRMQVYLSNDVDGFAINPYQLVDQNTYDANWNKKWFTKWFKKQPGVHYRGGWPRDLIYKNDEILYWKKNPRVPRIPVKFFHLSALKEGSFRKEDWAKEYVPGSSTGAVLPDEVKPEVARIYDTFTNHRHP